MRKTGMRLLAVLLAVVMVLPSVLIPGMAAEATGFTDVPEGSWYGDAVNYVSEKGYMAGVGDNKFAPNDEVTRAMFVTILARITMAETDGTASAFTDVPANKWYTGAVSWAAENGIVNGVGDGMFAPGKSITRQDLCTILYRFVNAMDYELTVGEEKTFTDSASVSSYAAEAVRYASSVGLIAGYDDGTFRPKATATRAQMAVIIMRLARLLDGQIVKPEPMPAQSFDQTSEQMQVSVNAPEGALPENTKMTVSRVTDEAALAAIEAKAGTKVYAAADISFSKDETEIEPSAEVEVQIVMDGLESIKNPTVVHVKDDGSLEYVAAEVVSATRGSEKALRFYAKDFSVYAVTDNQTNATLTISFYAQTRGTSGGWEIVNKQIIRANQLGTGKYPISDPGVPNITTSQAFEGWIQGTSSFNSGFTYGTDATTKTVKQINEDYQGGLAGNTEIVYYAAVYDVVYVTYHDQAGAVIHAEYEKLSGGYVEKLINVPYNPFKANQHWAGWVPANYWIQAGDVNGTMPTYAAGADDAKWTDGSSHRLTASVNLYPYLEEGFWLYFDSNKSANNTKNGFDDSTSADYTHPVFVAHGKNTAAPAQPNRAGYTFEGWYTDKDMTTRFPFGSPLNEETVVYAKWKPAAASYTVVFMVQNATDPYDNDVSNNTYSFYDAVSRDWTWNSGKQSAKSCDEVSAFTASSVTQNDAYLGTGALSNTTYYPSTVAALGQYFKYSDKNTGNTVKVKGDGSTVLYVYYDRKPVTLKFYKGSYSSSTADTTYNYYYYYTASQYFGYISGNYVPLTLVYNSSQTSSQGALILTNYASFKVTSTGAPYRDTVYVYVRGTASASNLVASITGLYGADISETDKARFEVSDPYVYCYESGTDSSGNQLYTNNVDFWEYVPGPGYSGNAFTINYYLQTWAVSTSEKTLHYISQDPETGAWGVEVGTDTVTNVIARTVGNSVGRRFIGYNLSTDSMTASSFVPLDGNTHYYFYYNNITGNDAYAYMELINYDLIFMSFSEVRREKLRYQQKTEKYQYKRIDENTLSTTDLYVPADGPAGYYFDGWYTDSTYQSEFKFTGKMPARNVTLYAKWSPIRFRVVCDPTDNGTNTDVSFSGNQTTMFVLNYDEKVDSIGLNSARSEGKILLGWFLDPDCTKPFSFETHLTPNTEGMDMTYAESTSRTWTDTWDGGNTVTDPENVRGILRLYAKWRVNPEGVTGIKVRYLADHAENDKGYFDSDSAKKDHEMTLTEVYTDQALAAAYSATVPAMPYEDTQDGSRRFLYWEILDKFGNPTGEIVYPGAPFTVDINNAVVIKTPQPDPTDTNEGASAIVSVAAVAPTCTGTGGNAVTQPNLSSGKADSSANLTNLSANANPNPVTATTDKYEKVTSFENGKKYLISYNNYFLGNTAYVGYGIRTVSAAPTQGSDGKYTFSTDMAPYLVEASENNGTWAFKALGTSFSGFSGDAYVGFTYDYRYGYYAGFSSTPYYWTLSGNYLLYTYNYNNYYLYSANGYFNVTTSTYSNRSLSFYKLVEDTDYTVTVDSSITNGTVSASPTTAAEGDLITLSVSPNTGYELATLTVTDASNNPVTVTNNQFTMPASNVTVYATFTPVAATTYSVTVASGITNGTVSASPTTATAGDTVTLTVTPNTGYELETLTVTDARNNHVIVTNNQFTMPASDVTVSATFSSVATDWKVSFADENGYPIPSMNDVYVPKNDNELAETDLPDPAKEDYYFLGWYLGNDKCTFPMTVESNITLTPKYSPMYSYDYTLTLRAVYGPYNPDATTHIYWYANNGTEYHNGAGERYTSKYTVTEGGTTTTTTKLPINAHVDIPLPTGNPASQTVFVGDKGGALTWEDHVFLGWARVDNGGSAEYAEARILTPDDIYLKWTGTEYEVRNDDGTYSPFSSQKVYADETTPYHDMYAVWQGFYYVFHSSDGTMEAIPMDYNTTRDDDGKVTAQTTKKANLVVKAEEKGTLYGGYFQDYGGAKEIRVGDLVGKAAMKSRINSEILQANGFWNYETNAIATGKATSIDLTANGAVDYTATNDKIELTSGGTVKFWNKNDAYGRRPGDVQEEVRGDKMTPVVGEIYFLKEVPDAYLPNVALAIKDTKDVNGNLLDQISEVYLLSASDELLYNKLQYNAGGETNLKATVSARFIVDYREYKPDGTYIPRTEEITLNELNEDLNGKIGWIMSYRLTRDQFDGAGLQVKPNWVTLDGVTVNGTVATYTLGKDSDNHEILVREVNNP